MRQIPKPYELYRHFKGDTYQILAIAKHSETEEKLVVYQGLYGECPIYARPLEMFLEKVDKVKYPDAMQEYRFEQVTSVAKAEAAEPPKQAALQESGPAEQEAAELQLDPMVLAFLDADSYARKLEILTGLQHRITDDMITTMAMACDVEVPEGPVNERYKGLQTCLLTLQKYECNRLR
ncbi:MAG: DUF1653 domain-containing protein [Lachnospiraceae bacterium]|nr:DUF1653 domain-containing protein [Lachnospiraceae bacterium]